MNFIKKKNEGAKAEVVPEESPTISYEEGLASLTNKNAGYIHDVHKLLSQSGKSEEDIKTILEDVLPEILDGQKRGVLARVLKGTPTEFAEKYKPKNPGKEKKETNKNPYLMILDGFLLFFALLGAIFGVTMEFKTSNELYGLTTLILTSIIGSIGMYAVYRQQTRQAGDKSGEKPSIWQRIKPTLQLIGFVFVWFIVMVFSAFLPRPINPVFDGITMIILAAVSFSIHFLLKRKYNIQSSFTPRVTQ